jgi:hypothetical protein
VSELKFVPYSKFGNAETWEKRHREVVGTSGQVYLGGERVVWS